MKYTTVVLPFNYYWVQHIISSIVVHLGADCTLCVKF